MEGEGTYWGARVVDDAERTGWGLEERREGEETEAEDCSGETFA